MTTFLPISTYPSSIKPSQDDKTKTPKCCGQILIKPNNIHYFSWIKIGSLHQRGSKLRVYGEKWSIFELDEDKEGLLFNGLKRKNKIKGFRLGVFREKSSNFDMAEDIGGVLFSGLKRKNNKRVVLARLNKENFGFNSGGGGGGDSSNGRILGNLALAVGLTYLSLTGQLGWLLDAIVSVWLLAVILPIVGLGALFWWAGRDIVQSSCPNCRNEFQIFRSVVNEDSQQCPYCSQPFSVVDDEFVRDPGMFSGEANTFGEVFNDFFPGSKKEKKMSKAIVDVEAEVKDVE